MDWLMPIFNDWRWLIVALIVLFVLVAIVFFRCEVVELYEMESKQEDDYD